MARYRNTRTGIEFETTCQCKGKYWEEIKPVHIAENAIKTGDGIVDGSVVKQTVSPVKPAVKKSPAKPKAASSQTGRKGSSKKTVKK